jgi:transcription elongation GreA/GreB family factor
MSNVFTRQGLELKQRQIKEQERKVRAVGKEVGEEAGINCDWHDNFGYEDSKRRLELESQILRRLNEEVAGAVVVSVEEQCDRVAIGVTVKLLVNDESKEFTIGAYGESNPGTGLISYNSPLAAALIGARVGDSVATRIAGKTQKIQIEKILPPSDRYNQLIDALLGQGDAELR